jgi:hypothetical protein
MGDSDENSIFNAVGRALTEWEQVESACARLFALLVSANQRRAYHAPAVRAYGCINSVATKCEMLRLAATPYFARRKSKAQFESPFKKLMSEYSDFSARRNDIAHGSVKRVFITEKSTAKGHRRSAIGFYLLPSFYNPKKFKEEKFSYQYTSSDLIHYQQEFTKLSLRIGGLIEQMAGKLRP